MIRPVVVWAVLTAAVCCTATSTAAAQTIAVAPPAARESKPLPKAWVRLELGGGFVLAPGSPTYAGYGIHILGLRVELPRVAFLLVPRFANLMAPAREGHSAIALNGSLGARYLLRPAAFSPFVGAGLTYGLMSIDDTPGLLGEADGSGAGAYVEGGYELFRSTWYQLSAGVRVDTPFYRPESETDSGGMRVHRRHYVVPVSFEVTISLPWPTSFIMF